MAGPARARVAGPRVTTVPDVDEEVVVGLVRGHRRVGTRGVLALLGFLTAAGVAAAAGRLAAAGGSAARRSVVEVLPAWAPPAGTHGVVWPVLYVCMGLAAWRVWRASGGWPWARAALVLWGAQLVVNAAWPAVFFGGGMAGAALAMILTLDVLVVTTIVAFAEHDRPAALLLVPYLVWLLYATALNTAVWWPG